MKLSLPLVSLYLNWYCRKKSLNSSKNCHLFHDFTYCKPLKLETFPSFVSWSWSLPSKSHQITFLICQEVRNYNIYWENFNVQYRADRYRFPRQIFRESHWHQETSSEDSVDFKFIFLKLTYINDSDWVKWILLFFADTNKFWLESVCKNCCAWEHILVVLHSSRLYKIQHKISVCT